MVRLFLLIINERSLGWLVFSVIGRKKEKHFSILNVELATGANHPMCLEKIGSVYFEGILMTKSSIKAYIFLYIFVFLFVSLLFLLRSFLMPPSLIQTSNTPAINQKPKYQNIDESSLANEIFYEINQKRLELGNDHLEWDERIHRIAKAHSLELQTHTIFSHQNLEEANVKDRLRSENLFFLVAAENLAMLPTDTKKIPDVVIGGWMKSPGHRSVIVDRDHFFTHGAVGVSCDKSSCYVTFNCADFIVNGNLTLRPDHYTKINLNDESLGLRESYPVNINIESSNPVNIYFFESLSKMNTFIRTGSDMSYEKLMNQTNVSDWRLAEKDSYILIDNNSILITDVNYELIYN